MGLICWETFKGLWDSRVGQRLMVLRNGARGFKLRLLGRELERQARMQFEGRTVSLDVFYQSRKWD